MVRSGAESSGGRPEPDSRVGRRLDIVHRDSAATRPQVRGSSPVCRRFWRGSHTAIDLTGYGFSWLSELVRARRRLRISSGNHVLTSRFSVNNLSSRFASAASEPLASSSSPAANSVGAGKNSKSSSFASCRLILFTASSASRSRPSRMSDAARIWSSRTTLQCRYLFLKFIDVCRRGDVERLRVPLVL